MVATDDAAREDAMLGDIAGLGPVREALTTTNDLLGQVLVELRRTNAELRRTNGEQLAAVVEELREVHASIDKIAAEGARPAH